MGFPHLDESIFRAELEQNSDSARFKGAILVVEGKAAALFLDRGLENRLFVLDGGSLGDETFAGVGEQEGLDVGEERTAPGLQGIQFILHPIFSYGHQI